MLVCYRAWGVTVLGVLQCRVCYSVRCVIVLGVLQCWVCYSAGCVTVLGVLQCRVCYSAGCVTVPGVFSAGCVTTGTVSPWNKGGSARADGVAVVSLHRAVHAVRAVTGAATPLSQHLA